MSFRFILIPLLILSLYGNPAASHAASILVWGDSLSAGYGLRPEQAWPALLQTLLEQEGFRYSVINGSVSGETSAGGLSRLPAALERHTPDILIIELGANDGLRGLRPQSMAENLAAMVDMAQRKNMRILLIGMEMPPNYGPAYVRSFRQAFHDVAEQRKVAFVPFLLEGFAEKPELFQADNVHPTTEAQPLILQTVWKKLRPLLQDDETRPESGAG